MSHPRPLSRRLCLLIFVAAAGTASAQQPGNALLQPHEEVQDCLRQLWGEPVFWDERAVTPLDPSVCKSPADKMDESLKDKHVVAFRLSNSVLITNDWNFRPESGALRYRWKKPEINIRVLSRLLPGSRPPTEAELNQVADAAVRRSHLVPLALPIGASEDQIGRVALNIYVWVGKLRTGTQEESGVALLAASDAEHENVVGTGRLVYGDFEAGHFQYRWESPLIDASMFEFGFVDLLRNGYLQIVLTSPNVGMGHHTAFFAFDSDGHELSRDSSNCGAFDLLTAYSSVACPIMTDTNIEIVDTVSGPKQLVTTDESGKKVQYVFKDSRYQQFPASGRAKPPSVPRATALNDQGMQLMQRKNYDEAIGKFEEAAQLNDKDPLFSNNAGFAYYKLERYQDSLYWFNKAIEIDPNRAVAYLNLADAYAKLNRNADARDAYKKYLELAPDSKAAPGVKKKLDSLPPSP